MRALGKAIAINRPLLPSPLGLVAHMEAQPVTALAEYRLAAVLIALRVEQVPRIAKKMPAGPVLVDVLVCLMAQTRCNVYAITEISKENNQDSSVQTASSPPGCSFYLHLVGRAAKSRSGIL